MKIKRLAIVIWIPSSRYHGLAGSGTVVLDLSPMTSDWGPDDDDLDFPDIPLFADSDGPDDLATSDFDLAEFYRDVTDGDGSSRLNEAVGDGDRRAVRTSATSDDRRSTESAGPTRSFDGPSSTGADRQPGPDAADIRRLDESRTRLARSRVNRSLEQRDDTDTPGDDGGRVQSANRGLRPVRGNDNGGTTADISSARRDDAKRAVAAKLLSEGKLKIDLGRKNPAAVAALREFESVEFLATLYGSKHQSSGAQLVTFLVPWEETTTSEELRKAFGRVLKVTIVNYDGS